VCSASVITHLGIFKTKTGCVVAQPFKNRTWEDVRNLSGVSFGTATVPKYLGELQ